MTMAVIKVISKKYVKTESIEYLIRYATKSCKTNGCRAIGVYPNDPEKMIEQIKEMKRLYEKTDSIRQVRHIIISFSKREVDRITLNQIPFVAFDIAKFYGNRYQICYGVHYDTDDVHIHFIQNNVNYIDGKLYSGSPMELESFKRYVNSVIYNYAPELNPVQTIEDTCSDMIWRNVV